MSGTEEKKKGGTYVSLKDRSVDLEIGGATMYFDNLFNGNKQLGKWRLIKTQIKSISAVLKKIFKLTFYLNFR